MAIKTKRLRLLGGGILALAGASLPFAAQARTCDVTAHGARPEWGIVLEQEGAPHPVRLNGLTCCP